MLAFDLPDAVVYDIFAGTGSLGLESLSRGCKRAFFFESNRSAQNLLRENIKVLKLQNRATVIGTDVFKWFVSAPPAGERPSIVFLDPPYRFLSERPLELQKLAEQIVHNHLADSGRIIFRHDGRDHLELPGLSVLETRDYGSMRVEFLTPQAKP